MWYRYLHVKFTWAKSSGSTKLRTLLMSSGGSCVKASMVVTQKDQETAGEVEDDDGDGDGDGDGGDALW